MAKKLPFIETACLDHVWIMESYQEWFFYYFPVFDLNEVNN